MKSGVHEMDDGRKTAIFFLALLGSILFTSCAAASYFVMLLLTLTKKSSGFWFWLGVCALTAISFGGMAYYFLAGVNE